MRSRSVLDLVTAQHKNAGTTRRRELSVDFAPARELARACNNVFGLVDKEDDYQREVVRLIWRLKLTVLQTLLPFDDERLDLRQMVARLSKLAEGMPAIAEAVHSISSIVDAALKHPKNPKLERVAAGIGGTDDGGADAILAGLQGASSPGWPLDVDPVRDLALPGVTVLRSRRDVQGKVFSRLVVPGSLRFAARPLAYDLLHGGRASEIVIAAYRGERIYIPEPLALPRDTTFAAARSRRLVPTVDTDEAPDEALDKWVNDSFWEGIRAQHPDVTPASDRDVPVSARFVLFADASGAFLPEDRTVIEVSDLLDRQEGLDVDADHMPRKAVSDLDERDLVLLRLSGSGDYLDEIADAMMSREGRPELRHEATEWKSLLHASLKTHGEGIVAREFRERGGRLRSAGYLWVWAGESVIAPQSFETFRLLIAVLSRLGVAGPADPTAYAKTKWEEMELVKDYHRRAGSDIRTALLERVKRLIAERTRIDSVASIDLPGVSSGRMGLLRISAVDTKSARVPYSRLFHIHPLKVT
jgi:hypothetical protein